MSKAQPLKFRIDKYFTPHFTEHVITYPCWDISKTMLVKAAPTNEVKAKKFSSQLKQQQ